MLRSVLVAAAFLSLSCATGRIDPDGTIHGAAIGESSMLERCVNIPVGEAGVLVSASVSTACSRIVGGPLLPSLLDGVGTVAKALFSWITL